MSRSKAIRTVNVIFLAAALAAVVWFIGARREEIFRVVSGLHAGWLAAAFLLLVAFQFAQALLVAGLLNAFGARLARLETVRVILLSLLGKYVPGKIWIFTMRATFFAERGVSMKTVLSAAAMEHILLITTGVSLYLVATPPDRFLAPSAFRCLGAALFLALAFAPRVLTGAANRAFRLAGRSPVAGEIGRRRSLLFSTLFVLTWLFLGAGIWLLARSAGVAIPGREWPVLSGIYAFSVVAGFLAVFAPGGIGVRDGLFALAVGRFATPVEAVFVALAARLVTSLAELAALGIVHLAPGARAAPHGAAPKGD